MPMCKCREQRERGLIPPAFPLAAPGLVLLFSVYAPRSTSDETSVMTANKYVAPPAFKRQYGDIRSFCSPHRAIVNPRARCAPYADMILAVSAIKSPGRANAQQESQQQAVPKGSTLRFFPRFDAFRLNTGEAVINHHLHQLSDRKNPCKTQ